MKPRLKKRTAGGQILRRLSREQRLRMLTGAALAFAANLLFAVYHGVLGFANLSLWFVAMGAYYAILSITRFAAVLCGLRRAASPDMEFFVMKLTGVMLALMSLVLSGVLYVGLSQHISIKHAEIIMITIAAYTFYKATAAIMRAVKQRQAPSPLLAVIRNIGYADAAASMLTLQRSMFATFAGADSSLSLTMDAITGAAVCLFVLALGISLLVRGQQKEVNLMAKSKLVKANEKLAEKLVNTYEKIEETVVGGYNKVEETVVGGYNKIEDAFVDRYLTRDGETVEAAKKRLKGQPGSED